MLIAHLHSSIAFHRYCVKGKGEFSDYFYLVPPLIFLLDLRFSITYNLLDCGTWGHFQEQKSVHTKICNFRHSWRRLCQQIFLPNITN